MFLPVCWKAEMLLTLLLKTLSIKPLIMNQASLRIIIKSSGTLYA